MPLASTTYTTVADAAIYTDPNWDSSSIERLNQRKNPVRRLMAEAGTISTFTHANRHQWRINNGEGPQMEPLTGIGPINIPLAQKDIPLDMPNSYRAVAYTLSRNDLAELTDDAMIDYEVSKREQVEQGIVNTEDEIMMNDGTDVLYRKGIRAAITKTAGGTYGGVPRGSFGHDNERYTVANTSYLGLKTEMLRGYRDVGNRTNVMNFFWLCSGDHWLRLQLGWDGKIEFTDAMRINDHPNEGTFMGMRIGTTENLNFTSTAAETLGISFPSHRLKYHVKYMNAPDELPLPPPYFGLVRRYYTIEAQYCVRLNENLVISG